MRVTLILFLLFFFATELFGAEAPVAKDSVMTREELDELYAIPEKVFRCLLYEEKELQSWSEELEKKTPQTLKDVWTTFAVCGRAGKNDIVRQMIVLMHDMMPEKIERPDQYANHVYYNIRFNRQTPTKCNPVRVFYESFGAVYSPNSHSEIDPVINDMRNEKWSQEQINQWLKERFEQALNGQSKNPKNIIWFSYINLIYPISSTAQNWLRDYFVQLHKSNCAEQIVTQFANEARENPKDFAKLAVFLLSLKFCNKTNLDVNWLSNNIDQYTAVQMWIIGRSIVNVNDSIKLRETFLKRALDKTLDNEDCKRFHEILQTRTSMHLPKREDELVQAIFHVEVMDDLNKMYLDQKRNDEAQKIMIAARELRKKYNLPKDSLLAGMTQMLSGQRIVETEIKNREAIDNTKPAYWMERANYYQGRKEPLEQEKALRKALSLYDTPELRGKNPNPSFCDVRSSLNYFLKKANRQADMYELFLQQHKIVKDEPRNLWELYSEGINNGIFAERQDEFLRLLSEDIKKAVNCYKTASIKEKQEQFSELRTGLDLIRFSPKLAVSMGIFDFQNDPDAWDILTLQDNFFREKIIQLLLFQEDKNGITLANENMIELFYTALEEKKLPVELYYSMGKVIRAKATQLKNIDGYKTALKFFKGALTHLDQFPNNYPKYSIHSEIASCYLKIGDWRNGEKYTVESYENSGLRKYEVVSWLDHAARVADKAGEKNEAKRIRQRITNLGIQ